MGFLFNIITPETTKTGIVGARAIGRNRARRTPVPARPANFRKGRYNCFFEKRMKSRPTEYASLPATFRSR